MATTTNDPYNTNLGGISGTGQNYTTIPTTGSTSQSTQSSSGQSSSSVEDTADAELSRAISALAEDYGTTVFNWANSSLAPNTALTNQAVGSYMQAANASFNLANTTQQQYNNIGAPELADLNNQAGSYSSGARQNVNAGAAEANSVQGSYSGLAANKMALQGYGINPNSGMFAELDASNKAAAGASAAAAGTQAAATTRGQGQTLTGQAVSADQQLPGQSTNATTAGVGAVSGAENAQLANTTTGAGALDAANPFFTSAQNITPEGTQSSSSQESSGQTTSNSAAQTIFTGAPSTQAGSSLAKGGAIPDSVPDDATSGGFVSHHLSPSKGAVTDDIPARLNADEFVMPKDVSKYYGQKTFQDMILKARKAMGSPDQSPAKPEMKKPAQGFAFGGGVGGFGAGADNFGGGSAGAIPTGPVSTPAYTAPSARSQSLLAASAPPPSGGGYSAPSTASLPVLGGNNFNMPSGIPLSQ